MFEFGTLGTWAFGLAIIGVPLAACGAVLCVLFRVPIRGPIFRDDEVSPYGLSVRLMAYLVIPCAVLAVLSVPLFILGI